MSTKNIFLIWLDILGFDALPKQISQITGLSERKIRSDFIEIINDKIKELTNSGVIFGYNYNDDEDWLLAVESMDSIYEIIYTLFDHDTEISSFKKIPLEIAIGYKTYNMSAVLKGKKLIIENQTIQFLKSNISYKYRKWFKEKNKESIKESYIIISNSLYNTLNYFEQKNCLQILENDAVFYLYDYEYVINKGKLLFFLKEINISNKSIYKAINDVYIYPIEYQEIINKLNKDNLIILIGDPEIGKTYTALKLLWEYYNEGFSPIWYFGSEIKDRKKIRKIISECNIDNGKVIYFEDPFGKFEYEQSDILIREFSTFIDRIQNIDSKIIITSRYSVFRNFQNQIISQKNIESYSVDMVLMKPSYSFENYKEILLHWAHFFNCKWLNIDDDLINAKIIIKTLNKLKTPLSIKDFCISTENVDEINVIEDIIKDKSIEVKISFAKEISSMIREKIVFLSLIYILYIKSKNDINNVYIQICNHLHLDPEKYHFDDIYNEFTYRVNYTDVFTFSHPSYEEGLIESWNIPEIQNLYLKIIRILKDDPDPIVRGLCGLCLIKNYSKIISRMQNEVKETIYAILHDKKAETRYGVVAGFSEIFRSIPDILRSSLLDSMLKDRHRDIRAQGIRLTIDHNDTISTEKFLEIINDGLEDRAIVVRIAAVRAVLLKINDFPTEFIQKALDCCEGIKSYSGWFLHFFGSTICNSLEKRINELDI